MGQTCNCEQLPLFDLGGIDMARLRERRAALRGVQRAPLTVKGYASDWRVFSRWCGDAGRSALPASEETLELYVTWLLAEEGRRSATATRHLASVVARHKSESLAMPPTAGARDVITSIRRQRRERPGGKSALDAADLLRVAKACDARTNMGSRDRALIVFGFATSLRRSELCRLQLSDVTFDRRGLVVLVRYSKADQAGAGRVLGVWAGKRSTTDPVRVLRAWIARRGDAPGPLFCRVQTRDTITAKGITGDSVNDIVKRAVARVGLNPARFGAHSLRAGAVTSAAAVGREDAEIMRMSGHASSRVMRQYVRHERVFSGRNPLAGVL